MFREIKTLIKHSSIYGASNILSKGIGFIMIPIYTHLLAPSDYGVLELLDLTINVITMLLAMNMGSSIVRYYHHFDKEQDKNEVFTTALISIALLCVVVVGVFECFTEFFAKVVLGKVDYSIYFQIIFISMGLQTIASVPENLLLARKQSFIYSAVSIGTLFSYLTFNIIFLVVYRMGVMGILLSMVITKVLNTSSLLLITFSKIKLSFSFEKLKQMLKYSLPLVPASMSLFVIHFSDRFFLRTYCSLEEIGLYSLGYKFGMMLSFMISQPIFQIWGTQRFEIAKKDHAKYTIGKIFTYYSGVVIFFGLGISLFIDDALKIMTPLEYHEAATIVPVIVLSYILCGMGNFFTLGIAITFKTKYLGYINTLAAGLNILFNLFFIQRYGVMGAAISTVLTFFFIATSCFLFSQRLFSVTIEYRRLFKLLALSLFILFFSFYIHTSLLISIGLKSLLILSFPGFLYLFGFFSKEELRKGREILQDISIYFCKLLRKSY